MTSYEGAFNFNSMILVVLPSLSHGSLRRTLASLYVSLVNLGFRKSIIQILQYLHQVADYCLELVKLLQNREVGWQTVKRKTGKYEREQQPLLKKLDVGWFRSRTSGVQ